MHCLLLSFKPTSLCQNGPRSYAGSVTTNIKTRYKHILPVASRGADVQSVIANGTGCGFDALSRKCFFFIILFLRSGIETKCGSAILPLNTQYLQNSAVNGE